MRGGADHNLPLQTYGNNMLITTPIDLHTQGHLCWKYEAPCKIYDHGFVLGHCHRPSSNLDVNMSKDFDGKNNNQKAAGFIEQCWHNVLFHFHNHSPPLCCLRCHFSSPTTYYLFSLATHWCPVVTAIVLLSYHADMLALLRDIDHRLT